MQKLLITIIFIFSLFFGQPLFAQENTIVSEFTSSYVTGVIIDTEKDENGLALYLTRLQDGTEILVDTYGLEVSVGNTIYLEYFPEMEEYNFETIKRTQPLIIISLLFIGSILLLAGRKGFRSLGSLGLSLAALLFGLVPLILAGYDPLWLTLGFGLLVLFASIFLTHGFNYQSLVSFLGSFASILLAWLLLAGITEISSLTGLINDEIQFLSYDAETSLNLVRIVSASIIIGILGVLDDITITQVAVVRELSSDVALSAKDIFVKALRVGRDHISSLVNTLVFAYIGATLPMILFITLLDIPFLVLISQEFIFIEIIRSFIGAIALTLAVPLTTWMATHVFLKKIHSDTCSIESPCAHHHH